MKNKEEGKEVVVIINADDFGYHPSIDQGILYLIKGNRISSISAMVNTANIQNAALKVKQIMSKDQSFLRSLSIGLHFNITEGQPISKSILDSQLVQNGKFIGKPKIFQIAKQTNSFLNLQIQEQLLAQIDKFITIFGRMPSHIDGHNHVHLIPTIAPICAKTMRQQGIYRTRIPLEKLQQINLPINNMFLEYAQKAKISYDQNGIIYSNQFVGLQSFGKLSSLLLLKAIQNQQLFENGSVEMMCHPGYPALEGSQWIKSEDRLKQIKQLSSQQFDFIKKQHKYANYYDLTAKQSNKQNVLICFQRKFKLQTIKIQNKEIRHWIKDERIPNKTSKIDLTSLVNSLKINKIIQIYFVDPLQYISQVAQNNKIPLILIRSQSEQQIYESIKSNALVSTHNQRQIPVQKS